MDGKCSGNENKSYMPLSQAERLASVPEISCKFFFLVEMIAVPRGEKEICKSGVGPAPLTALLLLPTTEQFTLWAFLQRGSVRTP